MPRSPSCKKDCKLGRSKEGLEQAAKYKPQLERELEGARMGGLEGARMGNDLGFGLEGETKATGTESDKTQMHYGKSINRVPRMIHALEHPAAIFPECRKRS